MNILHKIMLASYYDDRVKDKTPEDAILRSKAWMGLLFMWWSLCIELGIRKVFNANFGLLSLVVSLNIKEVLLRNLLLVIIFFSLPFYFSKSKEEFEELYNSNFLDYTKTWMYVWIPFIIPFFIMFFFL